MNQNYRTKTNQNNMVLNITNGSSLQPLSNEPPDTTLERILVPLTFAVIFLLGLMGNSGLLYIVMKQKDMQTIPNVYIANLAFGDLLVSLICVPFTATVYIFEDWPYGTIMCKLNEFLQTLSLAVSVFSLTILSSERYRVITGAAISDSKVAKRKTAIVIGLVWVVSVLIALPELIACYVQVDATQWGDTLHFCNPFPPSWGKRYAQGHTVVRFILLFAIPICVITAHYGLLARHLASPITRPQNDAPSLQVAMPTENTAIKCTEIGQLSGEARSRRSTKRIKAAFIVLAMVIMFVFCWLPRHVYLFWYHFDPGLYNHFWHVFKIFGFCLVFINSCVNPLILYYLDLSFRLYCRRYMCSCCCPYRNPMPSADNQEMENLNLPDMVSQTDHVYIL